MSDEKTMPGKRAKKEVQRGLTPKGGSPSLDGFGEQNLPRIFGRYELQVILGEGGMGRVFRAELRGPAGFRKQVAIKVIKSSGADSFRSADLIKEARIGGLLKHPNIIDVYELGEVDGQMFISMEFIEGITLRDLIRSQDNIPSGLVLEVALAVAAGLAKAHGLVQRGLPAGLVHCDLKPSNILISWDGAVKIADFGIAFLLGDREGGEDGWATLRGTPSYMSPEQLGREELDGRSDLFALALVIAAMTIGRNPLGKQFLHRKLLSGAKLESPLLGSEDLRQLDARTPGLGRLLLGCLAPDREDRYSSVESFARELQALKESSGPAPPLATWLAQRRLEDEFPTASPVTPETFPSFENSTVVVKRRRSKSNLGPRLELFVGREEELATLQRAIYDRSDHLVTLTGPGGAGKTRVARRFARRHLEQFEGGVWFADLTEARSAEGVLHATASALDIPLTGEEDFEALSSRVGYAIDARGVVLVILDNFEQVVDYGPVTLGRWRTIAPEARFLVTSREPTRLQGELVLRLGPLQEDEGVQLFEELARAAGGNWGESAKTRADIVRIVRQVDGLPLAIELAAARAALLSPGDLLDRLSERFTLLKTRKRDAKGRQATLERAIDWSWDLLQPWEQLALSQLSVFHGGFFMDAAESVLDLSDWPDAPWALDVVGSLLDKSLLYSRQHDDEPRFGMYVSLQDYAAGKLSMGTPSTGEAPPGTAAHRRHAAHYAQLGSPEYLDSLETHGGTQRWAMLATELENLLAGVQAGETLDDPESVALCALAAAGSLDLTGPMLDGVRLLDRAQCDGLSAVTRGRLLERRGRLKRGLLTPAEAAVDLREALRLARGSECRWLEGEVLRTLGQWSRESGERQDSEDLSKQALAIARERCDRRREGIVLGDLGFLYKERGNLGLAREHLEQALKIHREVGSRRAEGITLGSLGILAAETHDPEGARRRYAQSLTIFRELGDKGSEGIMIGNVAVLDLATGDLARARDHYEDSLAILREVGYRRSEGVVLGNLGTLRTQTGETDRAREDLEAALAIHREQGNQLAEGTVLGNLGDLYFQLRDLPAAESHLVQGIALCDDLFPVAGAAFRASLALIIASRGGFEEARSLLEQGSPLLQERSSTEYAKLLCKQARVEDLAGDAIAAQAALDQAALVAKTLGAADDSEVGQALATAKAALVG